MYCVQCGHQLGDQDRFCSMCGTPVGGGAIAGRRQESAPAASGQQEYDREALTMYLRDLLYIECFVSQVEAEHEKARQRIEQFEQAVLEQTCEITAAERGSWIVDSSYGESVYLHFRYEQGTRSIALQRRDSGVFLHEKPEDFEGLSIGPTWVDIEGNKELLQGDDPWDKALGAVNGRKARRAVAAARDIFWERYEEFDREVRQFEVTKLSEIEEWNSKLEAADVELAGLLEDRKELYDLDIVPIPDRDLQAIHYLYSTISSSNVPLGEALHFYHQLILHKDIQDIGGQLVKIDENQRKQLALQAIEIGQNATMIAQNEEQLRVLENIEGNTAATAMYAKLAARHAGACKRWLRLGTILRL